jgi:CRP-like cAMP-binding protein
VFSDVERLDIIRMVRLFVPPEFSAVALSPRAQSVADTVLRPFVSQRVLPEIERVVSELPIFEGLEREQVRRVAGACRIARFSNGETILEEGGRDATLFFLLKGEADIRRAGTRQRVGVVRAGECLGEMSLLTGEPHSASAVAARATEAATLGHVDLMAIIRARPDIGLVIFRNLAIGLGAKLGRAPLV